MPTPKKISEFAAANPNELVAGDWTLTELDSDNTPRSATIAQVSRCIDTSVKSQFVGVYHTGGGAYAGSTDHLLDFAGATADLANADMWVIGTPSRITIPAGSPDMLYSIFVSATKPADLDPSEDYKIQVFVDGTIINQAYGDLDGRIAYTSIVTLSAAQYVQTKFWHNSGSNRQSPTYVVVVTPITELQ